MVFGLHAVPLISLFENHCFRAWKYWTLEVILQSKPRLPFQAPSHDTAWPRLCGSILLQAPRELVCYSDTLGLTHDKALQLSAQLSPALASQDCIPFIFLFSALERLVKVGLHEGLTNEWMNKQNEILKPIFIFFKKKNKTIFLKNLSFESVLMRWMKLEPIIQSEVSQKDKDHYSILTHIYGI